MNQICIPVPLPPDRSVEMQVTVDGEQQVMQYRVETLTWASGTSPDERIEQLRQFIAEYDAAWSLVQVGAPGPTSVPVTFRRRGEKTAGTEKQEAQK